MIVALARPRASRKCCSYACVQRSAWVRGSAGTCFSVNKDEMLRLIRAAGFEPWQRDNVYGVVDPAP